MRITRIEISNFKGLQNISLNKISDVNVIVGPNAIGKTTIMESLRVTKAILVQRFNGEAQQTLINMGALSPHNPIIGGLGMDLKALANEPEKDIFLSYKFKIDDTEIKTIQSSLSNLALIRLESQMLRSEQQNILNFTQFLSTEEGQKRLAVAMEDVKRLTAQIVAKPEFDIALLISPTAGTIRGINPDNEIFLIILDRSVPPNKSLFNYFPADRALPAGDVALQLGAGDIQQQLLSYIANPSIKYSRFKQIVVQTILLKPEGRETLLKNFNLIFDELLSGKKIHEINYNEFGVMKVIVADSNSKKFFDIDQMSSGEKGLVLTLLLMIEQSINGGIVLLDEPELHLNSAVQAKILPFIIEMCVKKMGVQIFICTHSPEIVRDAYESDACSLYHLRSPNDIAPIYYQDTREVFEIFSRLGSSPADALFTKGAILVEGDDDVAIFRAGFPDIIAGYSVKPLSGRPEVVKEFARLQGEESAGNLNRLHLFIFDNDRKVQKLKDTKLVRHKQLQRYSIENYLLNEDVLYDLLQKFAANPPESRGIFPRELKEIALMQMDPFVIKEVYNSLEPPNAGLRPSEIKAATFVDASRILGERVLQLANSVSAFDLKLWMINFESLCNEKKLEAEPEWSAKWKELASGKEIFVELYRRYSPRVRDREFKRLAIEMMKEKASDDWAALAHLLKTGLA